MLFFSWIVVLLSFQQATAQYYYWPAYAPPQDQNASVVPYPYQTVLGLKPGSEVGVPNPQNMGVPSVLPAPYPYMGTYPSPVNMNAYYALLAQQGRPIYPGYPFYPQYIPQGFGYPQWGNAYSQFGGGYQVGANQPAKETNDIKTEILDVSPEYQRQVLGWPTDLRGSGQNGCTVSNCLRSKPHYKVDINQETSNVTNIPVNLTKPIVTEKRFITSIRRTFVYDSSKPENNKPINIHIINGQQMTTTPPPETTVNEDVQGTSAIPKVNKTGRRYMDVPKTCPKGTRQTQTGECIEPFLLRHSTANETYVDENAIEAERR